MNEKFSKDEIISSGKLEELKQHLDMVRQEIDKSQSYLPMETAGKCAKVVPIPGTDDRFIAVQVGCKRHPKLAAKSPVGYVNSLQYD